MFPQVREYFSGFSNTSILRMNTRSSSAVSLGISMYSPYQFLSYHSYLIYGVSSGGFLFDTYLYSIRQQMTGYLKFFRMKHIVSFYSVHESSSSHNPHFCLSFFVGAGLKFHFHLCFFPGAVPVEEGSVHFCVENIYGCKILFFARFMPTNGLTHYPLCGKRCRLRA